MSLMVFCKLLAAELKQFEKSPIANGASSSTDEHKCPLVNRIDQAVKEQPRECGKKHYLSGFDVPKHSTECG